MQKAFVCTNKKQMLGAQLSKFSIERASAGAVPVEIITVEDVPEFRAFAGKSFRRGPEMRTYTLDDLQSFTLTRFMPPELMHYEGQAFVIDPDIFAITDPRGLFGFLRGGAAVAACRKKDSWDSSVMVLDCAQLRHWSVRDMLQALGSGARDYHEYMSLTAETKTIVELPRSWNSLDRLGSDIHMLHTTNRLTQPWKTGLPIDFTRNPLPKILGVIPRELVLKLRGKYPSHYQKHPDSSVEQFFFTLVEDALSAGAVTRAQVEQEIEMGHVRRDLLYKATPANPTSA